MSTPRRRATSTDLGSALGDLLGPLAREGMERLAASDYGPILAQVLPVRRKVLRVASVVASMLTDPPAEPDVAEAEFVDEPPRRR